jgi:hypothetical protein
VQIYKQALASAKQKKERIEKEHSDYKNTKAMEEEVRLQELNRFKQDIDRLRSLLDKLQK